MAKCGFCGIRKPDTALSCWFCGQHRDAAAQRHAQAAILERLSANIGADELIGEEWSSDETAPRGRRLRRRRTAAVRSVRRRRRRMPDGRNVARPVWVVYHLFLMLVIYYVLLVFFAGGDLRWFADRPWVALYRWIAN